MKTVRRDSITEVELEIKRSRFLTVLARTETQEEARTVIDEQKQLYPDARHHCSAYVIQSGHVNALQRSSDDGEPAGTAGKPMLDVLVHAGLGDVTAVVTRYFGGTLLGTGGLVRAYAGSVQAAIDAAPLVLVEPLALLRTRIDLAEGGRVEAALRTSGWTVVDTQWGSDLQLDIAADPTKVQELNSQLSTLLQEDGAFQQVGEIQAEVDFIPDQP